MDTLGLFYKIILLKMESNVLDKILFFIYGKQMKTFFASIPLFVEVARQKSFSKAANTLNLGTSTISRHIKLLEIELGCTLFFRDTHSVQLTSAGERLFNHLEDILLSVNYAFESLRDHTIRPAGKIKIVMFSDIYYTAMHGIFSKFMQKWPEIHLDIYFYENLNDILPETYDIMFRLDPLPNSPMIAKKITTISLAPFASPTLLSKYHTPKIPQELSHIPCLSISRMANIWEMHKNNQTKIISISPISTVSSAIMLLELIIGGHGIGLLRRELAKPYEENKKLIRLLPDWTVKGHDVYLIVNNKPIPQRINLFIEYILNHFSKDININFINSLFNMH